MTIRRRLGGALHPPAAALVTRFSRTGARTFAGHVFDRDRPWHVFSVELLIDGRAVAVACADRFDPEAAQLECGDGCHGFGFRLDKTPEQDAHVEARLANLDVPVGGPLRGSQPAQAQRRLPEVRWHGGLRFSGWLPSRNNDGDERLAFLVDGEMVSEVRPSAWGRSEDGIAGRIFDQHLPTRFADGQVHRLAIHDTEGESLPGGPWSFVAEDGGFARHAAGPEYLRAELLDALVPMSWPMARYDEWKRRFASTPTPKSDLRAGIIVAGSGDSRTTLESLEEQSHTSWVAAALPPADGPTGFDHRDVSAFVRGEGARCDFHLLVISGARLNPDAVARHAAVFESQAQASLVYPDVAVEAGGSLWPLFFPAFDFERLLEQGYCANIFAARRGLLERALVKSSSSLYGLFVALHGCTTGDAGVLHMPGEAAVLPDFAREKAGSELATALAGHLGDSSRVEQKAGAILPAVAIRRTARAASISVIVICSTNSEYLARSINSVSSTTANVELLIAAHDDVAIPPGHAIVRDPGPPARVARRGVERSNGEFVCLIDAGVAAVEGWLEELLSRAAPEDAGAVGPLIVRSTGVVGEAGVVAGPRFALASAHTDRVSDDPGYGDLLLVAHQRAVLGEGCILLRREHYVAVGGIDHARFPEHFGIADLCLKLAASGLRNILTPHARMIDHRRPRGLLPPGERGDVRYERELANLRAKWADVIAADPTYSPMLSLDGVPYSALAWPPRSCQVRSSSIPTPAEIPPGF